MTRCGLVVNPAWPRRENGGLSFTPEMTEEEDDAEWDRICC